MTITDEQMSLLREYRDVVAAEYPRPDGQGSRLVRAVLFGSRARGDNDDESDWDVAFFIEKLDRNREGRPLSVATARFIIERDPGMCLFSIILPTDPGRVSLLLLRNIGHDGIEI